MEIKQLRYFVEVAKREHISETALELNIAQSAISRQITLLEQELNVALFQRQGRNISLTSEGKLLFNEALTILDHLDTTIEQFQNHGLSKHKSIYIGYEESDVSMMLLPLIQSFHLQNDTHIIPNLMTQDTIIDQVLNGNIDIGFTELNYDIKKHKSIYVLPLFEEHFHLYAPSDDPITLSTHPPLIQFENSHMYTLYSVTPSVKKQLQSFTKTDIYTISNKQLAQYILKQKNGYIICPKQISLPNSQDWVNITLEHTELKRTICAITKEPYVKSDIGILLTLIKQLMTKTSTFY
ncbi:LysR family transcriptional regulator [Staphylococcus simiae]|uniref:glutamate biosynthesis transcriptional regulator GltC n=1 Tax=Staphylococcus simiae TaxID=308354 RepID=UPI001A958BE1|nr:LysR family transcriptional regulator [Staphylococcus simiae]MBO1199731.1 LysR family transcriptional regulator [Staphylococcus simiae]MBO1202041.1 LysR family transcriptional regulator [Staphylococcus simiae]MBO1204286.1 LysR family transcriptional regulator [Staphylococcus simiae]MBO1211788.1 LysR family transcriptional regulator [Staphylococcus simiae]MBO1230461.1 LysR family transcriptional regulator [Staphylococcus simiae]